MIRRILSVATLAAVAATAAPAQTAAVFHVNNPSGLYEDGKGVFTSNAAAITGGGFTNNSLFQIWCVDQNHSSQNTNYNVNVSRLSGSLTATRANDLTKYKKAAFLGAGMTASNESANQYAIWATMHGRTASTECTSFGGVSGLTSCNSTNVGNAMTAAGAGYGTINSAEWYVITDALADGYNCNGYVAEGNWWNWNPCDPYEGKQEFIARCQTVGASCDGFDIPNEEVPVPEPATMSLLALGLAGMAGSSLRRRKK